MEAFRDRYGFLHDKPVINGDPLTSENGPCYDGICNGLMIKQGGLSLGAAWAAIKRSQMLYGSIGGTEWGWKVTPVSDRFDFSRDNWDGLYMTIEACRKMAKRCGDKDLLNEIKYLVKHVPILHKQRKVFYRDVPMAIAVKWRWTRWLGMMLPRQIACIVSMYQTHKFRNGIDMAKTDGKLMALGLCAAFNWKITRAIMDKMLKMKRSLPGPDHAWQLVTKYYHEDKWSWDSYFNMGMDYFRRPDHIITLLLKGEA